MLSHPGLNACLNASSAVLLVLGYAFIRRRRIGAHRACMCLAFLASTIFVVSYLAYHARVGSVRFHGLGWIRSVYFSLLVSHTVLALAVVPLALVTLSRALRNQFERHKRIAHWTLPIWFYVSITGVIIYWLLYHVYGNAASLGPLGLRVGTSLSAL